MKQHHSDVHTLTAAYALHALDPTEREAFAEHFEQCEACRQEVAEFEATAARLAGAIAQAPPAALRQRTMAALDGVRQLPPRVTATAPAAGRGGPRRRRAVSFALAACLAAGVPLAGVAAWQYGQREAAEQRARQAERSLDALSAVLAAPDARAVHARMGNGALTTVVSSARHNAAVFTASGLPAPAAGRTYQLWLDHDGVMRPAGFIRQDGTVLVDGDPSDATALGLTLEPDGGSRHPTTAPLLLMALPT
ncbi:anti-sigma factor domain-containing protein [Streptomyces sp. NPDC048018]|uniref:anti-sigma factor n=1 Tax=Streptomyces sp. NPDC048018 TaxID=3365499 RepID=UPI003724490A